MIDKDKFLEFIVENLSDIIKGHEDELLRGLNIKVSPIHLPGQLNISYLRYKDGSVR